MTLLRYYISMLERPEKRKNIVSRSDVLYLSHNSVTDLLCLQSLPSVLQHGTVYSLTTHKIRFHQSLSIVTSQHEKKARTQQHMASTRKSHFVCTLHQQEQDFILMSSITKVTSSGSPSHNARALFLVQPPTIQ